MNSRGAIGQVVKLIITAIAVCALVYLSVRSLMNTVAFTALASTEGTVWATVAGVFIQFSPNVFSYLARRETDGNQKLLWKGMFWLFTIVDAGTNVGRSLHGASAIPTSSEIVNLLAWALRILIFDIAVVFAEEAIERFVSVFFDQVADLVDILDGEAPEWLRMANSFGSNNSRKGQSKSQHNQGNRGNNQPVREQGNGREREHEFPLIDPRALNERDRGRGNQNDPRRR